jgi:phage-related protein
MAEIVKGLGNLVQSFFQIIWGTVTTIFNAITGTVEAALNFVFSLFKGVFNISEDVVKLIAGKSCSPLICRLHIRQQDRELVSNEKRGC